MWNPFPYLTNILHSGLGMQIKGNFGTNVYPSKLAFLNLGAKSTPGPHVKNVLSAPIFNRCLFFGRFESIFIIFYLNIVQIMHEKNKRVHNRTSVQVISPNPNSATCNIKCRASIQQPFLMTWMTNMRHQQGPGRKRARLSRRQLKACYR